MKDDKFEKIQRLINEAERFLRRVNPRLSLLKEQEEEDEPVGGGGEGEGDDEERRRRRVELPDEAGGDEGGEEFEPTGDREEGEDEVPEEPEEPASGGDSGNHEEGATKDVYAEITEIMRRVLNTIEKNLAIYVEEGLVTNEVHDQIKEIVQGLNNIESLEGEDVKEVLKNFVDLVEAYIKITSLAEESRQPKRRGKML